LGGTGQPPQKGLKKRKEDHKKIRGQKCLEKEVVRGLKQLVKELGGASVKTEL